MSTLEKGILVWVTRDNLNSYLNEHHVPVDMQELAKKIANISFEREAEAVILFMDNSTVTKNIKLTCYMPIYKDISILEGGGYTYENVDECIFLDALVMENIRTIKDTNLLFTVKNIAIRSGYWREEYGIVALS